MEEICQEVGLPNMSVEDVEEKRMEEAIFFNHYKHLKEDMKRMRKLDSISDGNFTKIQDYMKHHSLEFFRMAIRLKRASSTAEQICQNSTGTYCGATPALRGRRTGRGAREPRWSPRATSRSACPIATSGWAGMWSCA